ncbi:hypothetical protein EDB87DRAFT_1580394 [Lactarius vividus]|nr:hypothetical protein EDB87DRAFT_1580394 [Lactarius vividus]
MEGKDKPQYYKPLCALPMPARTDAGVPLRHSLALFSVDHTVRNEVDRALALVADPGAAADIHHFRMSMKRKQELFACMRDLDIAWNDWLAGAEDIDRCLCASNISSCIFPFLLQPLPRGLDIYHITEADSNDRRYRAHLDHLEAIIPLYPIPVCTEKSNEVLFASIAIRTMLLDSVPALTCYVNTQYTVASLFITRLLERRARNGSFIRLGPSLITILTQNASDALRKPSEVGGVSLKRG